MTITSHSTTVPTSSTPTVTASKTPSTNPAEKALIKIIVLGCANVGKTSIMERFARGKFSDIRRPTVGSDFLTKKIMIHDIEVQLQIWDTAGQERFHQGSIGAPFYRGAHGALLVYDVNNEKSIEQIAMWRDECLSRKEESDETFFPIVVVGNKIDLRETIPEEERVDQSQVTQWCRENSYGHIETSAKDGHGVEAAMMAVVGLALESQRNGFLKAKQNSISNNSSSLTSGGNNSKDGRIDLKSLYEPKKTSCCK